MIFINQQFDQKYSISDLKKFLLKKPDDSKIEDQIELLTKSVKKIEKYIPKMLSAEQEMEKGIIYFNKKEYYNAIPHLLNYLKFNPNSFECLRMIGDSYFLNSNFSQAIQIYMICIDSYTNDDQFWFQFGYSYKNEIFTFNEEKSQQINNKAIICFLKCIQLNQCHEKCFYELADCFAQKYLYKESIRCFQRCLEINPQNISYIYSLVYALFQYRNLCLTYKIGLDDSLINSKLGIQVMLKKAFFLNIIHYKQQNNDIKIISLDRYIDYLQFISKLDIKKQDTSFLTLPREQINLTLQLSEYYIKKIMKRIIQQRLDHFQAYSVFMLSNRFSELIKFFKYLKEKRSDYAFSDKYLSYYKRLI